jgi:hypothetical protein
MISERFIGGIKMPSRSNFFALLIAFVFLDSLCLAADKKQFSDAIAAVDANLKTPAGKQYDERIGKEFPEKYMSSLKQCKQSMPADASIDSFDMFLKLNAEGKVQEGLVHPETQFTVCARAALLAGKFSNPPHGDYWINIHMDFKH